MSINIASNFELFAALPLDARTVAADITARDAIASGQRYEGLWCYVVDSDGGGNPATYQLQNGITNGDWVFINSGTALTGIGNAESIAVWSSGTNLSANLNFTRSNATGIVNNEQGFDLGTNTVTERYIDATSGNDANDGLTALTAWQTRQHAYNQMQAYLPGAYQIIAANDTYSENLVPPYNSIGRGGDSGGTLVNNVGDETTPANSIIAGSNNIYENDPLGRGYSGAIRFAGSRFVGDNTGDGISSSAGLVLVRNCEFSQVSAAAAAQFQSRIFFEQSTAGGTADTIDTMFQTEDGGLIYVGTGYVVTNMAVSLASCGTGSSIFFGENLTFTCTGAGAGSIAFFQNGGGIATGEQNTFTMTTAQTVFDFSQHSDFHGGVDNQFDFVDCGSVGQMSDYAKFVTSDGGTGTYTVSGTTPTSKNFTLTGYSMVKNELNSGSGNPEIPMTWFVGEDLASTRDVLATDFRYTSPTISLPGELPQNNGFFITTQGLSDTYAPIFTAKYPCVFNQIIIQSLVANGPAAGPTSVTDTYTVYRNNAVTLMTGVITDGTELIINLNGLVCDPGDTIGLFVLTDANTLAENLSVAL